MQNDDLRQLDRLAWILDSSIPVPGTKFRVGVDGLVGLIPGIGDAIGALLSSYIIAQAAGSGAPASLLARMGLNVLVETVVGVVPLVGDLFDFAFKANARNVRLLRQHAATPDKARRGSRLVVASAGLVALAVIVAIVLVIAAVLRWAWGVLTAGA
jgi:hypothetical protein